MAVYGIEALTVSDASIWSSYTINGEHNTTHFSGDVGSNRLLLYQSDEMPPCLHPFQYCLSESVWYLRCC